MRVGRAGWYSGASLLLPRHPTHVGVQCEAQIDHLRHAKLAGLRDDKDLRKVIKEHADEA